MNQKHKPVFGPKEALPFCIMCGQGLFEHRHGQVYSLTNSKQGFVRSLVEQGLEMIILKLNFYLTPTAWNQSFQQHGNKWSKMTGILIQGDIGFQEMLNTSFILNL